MINRNVVIGIVILVLIGLGFLFTTSMTGNVITGSVADTEIVENEEYRISDFGAGSDDVGVNDSSDDVEVIDG